MAESTFSDPLYWLDVLTGANLQNHVPNEADKRKWGTLNDLPEPFVKHFNNSGTTDLLSQLGKLNNEASELDLSPNELRQKRKEQNRAAQRAFRERRQLRVKELEDKAVELEQNRVNETKHLQEENQALRAKVKRMEAEIYTLKGAENAFKLSIQKLREAGIQLPTDTTMALPTPSTNEPSSTTLSNISTASKQQQSLNTSLYNTSSISSSSSSSSSPSSSSPPSAEVDQSIEQFLKVDDRQLSSTPPKKSTYHSEGQHSPNNNNSNPFIADDDDSIGFAASETNRFNHQQDPLVSQGAKTIPYSQIWEKVQDHPKYDLFDIDLLCEDLKKKAKCSGSGAVILEEDFYDVLEKYDV